MPQIQLNHIDKDINISNYRTISELIPTIKDLYLKKDEFISKIIFDQKVITFKENKDFLEQKIDNNSNINIIYSKRSSIVQESLDFIPQHLDKILNNINKCCLSINKQKFHNAKIILANIIENIDLTIQLIGQLHKALSINNDIKQANGFSIKELEIHLLSIVKGINIANKNHDNIMLTDLLEYELKDNLTQWKIQAIPFIKNINSL
ncbi:MAG: hypothetical protein N4A33_09590 [Bacteriovoracaceae bacterium]|nr:hypothetical protein [Bacteriovoracaceae bacterium]